MSPYALARLALVAAWIVVASPVAGDPSGGEAPPTSVATPSSGVAIDAAAPAETATVPPPAVVNTEIKRSVSEPAALPFKGPPWNLRGLLPLGAVLVVMALLALVLRRYLPMARSRASGPLRVLHRTYLSPKQSVALLRVGRRLVLVGVTPDRINALCQIENADECAWMMAGPDGRPSETDEFERLLDEEGRGYGLAPIEASATSDESSRTLDAARSSVRDALERLRAVQGGAGRAPDSVIG